MIPHEYKWGVVLKQINNPISMLPLLFRTVDRIVYDCLNDPCHSCKLIFPHPTNCWQKKPLTEKDRFLIKMNRTTNLHFLIKNVTVIFF